MRLVRSAALATLPLAWACSPQGEAPPPPPSSAPSRPAAGPYDEASRLLARGQADAALAALQSAPPGAEALYLQGAAWAKKSETAPLPTPPPAPVPVPRGYVPAPAPDWKPEELQAVSFLEQAIAAEAGHARAHQALADLLAPHAVRQLEAAKAVAAAPKSRGKRGRVAAPPPAPVPEGPDASPDRVIGEYRAALAADGTSKEPVEALIAFCERVDRPSEAESAFEELLKRVREKPEPFVRYGDYLRGRRNFDAAITQYRQALIWKDDEATKAKIGEIYISMAEEHLGRQEWAAAEQRLRDAQKWVKDKSSPAGLKLQAAQAQLAQIRRGR
jgi:tetratricopeptide (TPR) repeat protein